MNFRDVFPNPVQRQLLLEKFMAEGQLTKRGAKPKSMRIYSQGLARFSTKKKKRVTFRPWIDLKVLEGGK